jgi:hypothetical protein
MYDVQPPSKTTFEAIMMLFMKGIDFVNTELVNTRWSETKTNAYVIVGPRPLRQRVLFADQTQEIILRLSHLFPWKYRIQHR